MATGTVLYVSAGPRAPRTPMANAGGQQGPQEYFFYDDEPMVSTVCQQQAPMRSKAQPGGPKCDTHCPRVWRPGPDALLCLACHLQAYEDAAATASQGTATQGVKRGRDGDEPGRADDAKRRRQFRDAHHNQAQAPAAAAMVKQQVTQDELARRAEDMLVQLKQVATRAAASWRDNAPSSVQRTSLDQQAQDAMVYTKRAFPAAVAGLPLNRVPAEQRHAVTLVRQAMEATKQACQVYNQWRTKAERSLALLTVSAVRHESAWRQAAPTPAQVSELQRRADATRKLVAEVFPTAAAGLPAAQVPAREARAVELLAQAKAAVDRALSVAKDWQVRTA